jgi:hypothetical protein
MKAITRRVRRLEQRLLPQANDEWQRLVSIIRERRRRRLEAAGLPFDDQHGKTSPRRDNRRGRSGLPPTRERGQVPRRRPGPEIHSDNDR